MKVEIATAELKELVQTVASAVDGKPNVAWMGQILFEAEGNALTATAINSLYAIGSSANCTVMQEGKVTIEGKMLLQVANKLPGGTCVIDATEEGKAILRCGKSRTTLAVTDAEEFIKPQPFEPTVNATINADTLRRMIGGAKYAIATTETRLVLTGMLFSVKDGKLFTVAIDGYRMSAYKNECVTEGEAEMIVPGRTVNAILPLLAKTEEVLITSDGKQFDVHNEKTWLHSNLIAGDFIDYKKIMPHDSDTVVKAYTKSFKDAVGRAMVIASAGKNGLVKMRIADGEITLSSNAEVGENVENLDASVQGADITIAFNGKYLNEALDSIADEEILLKMKAPTSPAIITPVEGNEWTSLILPVRVVEGAE